MSGQPPTLGGAKKTAKSKRKRSASSATKKAKVYPKNKSAKKATKKKPTTKKTRTTKKTKKAKNAGPTLAQLQNEAKRLKIALSKGGKKRDKAALKRAISRK